MYRTASRQLVKVSLIVIGFVALASHDPARADEPAKPRGPILELRILATPKHDEGAIAKSQADELERPPLGYRWVVVSLTVKGKSPAFGEKTLTDLEVRWKPDEGGAFQSHLGVIIDGRLISAPVARAEISDGGIIENMEPAAVDSLIETLRASIGKP